MRLQLKSHKGKIMYFNLYKLKTASAIIKGLTIILSLCASINVTSHGLMESPAARNQFCGVITKPDQVLNNNAQYPTCGGAFINDQEGGYNFMSVLTHAEGRKVVTPLPTNVCGFDSEVWDGGATPWDSTIDWPTNTMQPGINEIIWNISWGPHFDDTKEFSYWITNNDFVFDPNAPLTWSDFESEPFCDLQYDDSQPNANPNIQADKPSTKFHTFCTVPERTGRHVIYGEWGRNSFTYERFHGCIDAVFIDSNATPVKAELVVTPNNTTVTGAGAIAFDGTGSTGDNLTYQWSVSSIDDNLYTLSTPTEPSTQLTYSDPSVAVDVSVSLSVSNNNGSDNSVYTFEHLSSTNATWKLLGPLTTSIPLLNIGNNVTIRVVDNAGNDSYLPAQPLTIDSSNHAVNIWPYELAQQINTVDSTIAIGVINANGEIIPEQNATSNNIYTRLDSNVAGVYLNVDDPTANNCEFIINSDWGTGYLATIKINNNSDTDINGWKVSWSLSNSEVGSLWDANVITGATNTASNLAWNQIIAVGKSVEFGFNASRTSGTTAETPIIFGSVCN